MPLIALALAAYNAGLLAGFADLTRPACLLCAFAAAAAAGLRRFDRLGLAIVAVAGIVSARGSLASDRRCRAGALVSRRATVTLADSAFPGRYARGVIRHCNLSVGVSVTRGRGRPGATVAISGLATDSRRGLAFDRATVRELSPPPVFARLRERATRAVDATFPRDAPLARALLVADTRELPLDLRDRFAAAGLAHILSISGLHVGLIALMLELVLRLLNMSRGRASLIALLVISAYVGMLGFPARALRAAAMLAVRVLCYARQRCTSPWAILAVGALHPVLSPPVVTQIGYQLSVAGVAALIAAASLDRRLELYMLPRVAHALAGSILPTTLACVTTAPLVASTFGRVSLVAPLSNVVAAPLVAFMQPVLFAGLALSWCRPVARFIGDAAHPLLALLDRIAAVAAALPAGSVQVQPSPAQFGVAAVAVVALLTVCMAMEWHRPALLAVSAAATLLWLPLHPTASGLTELHVLDVGQGDAIALRTPHGAWVLVDAGGAWAHGNAGRSIVVPYFARRGGRLEYFILSHPHTDHVGGAAAVFDALRPARFVDGAFPGAARAYGNALSAAVRDGTRWVRAHPGDSLAIDGVSLVLLAPDSAWTATLADPNLASVVVRISVGRIRMLLTGDAEAAEERWMLAHDGADALSADVLKVGHHGSITSTTAAFLAAVAPRVAIVSVGAGNHYGLPDAPVLRALEAAGAQVLRTDKVGTVVVRTDGTNLWVESEHPLHAGPRVAPAPIQDPMSGG